MTMVKLSDPCVEALREPTSKHLFSITDLSWDCLDAMTGTIDTDVAGHTEVARGAGVRPIIQGTATLLFQEPSLRTLASFSVALTGLGFAPVPLYIQPHATRGQASFADEIKQLAMTGTKCIICRSVKRLHPQDYLDVSVPIINAGDGANEHPTQALVDIAVMRHFGLTGKTIAILGNSKDHRTIHSLCLGLRHFDVRVILLGPQDILPPASDFGDHVEVQALTSRAQRDAVFAAADFIYLTPFKYFDKPDYEDTYQLLGLNRDEAQRVLKPTAKVLHPFPRFDELDVSLDGSVYDAYQLQVQNGAFIRDRVLRFVLQLDSAPADLAQ